MMSLARVFMEGGLLMFPLVLIVLVLFGIFLRTVWHLHVHHGSDAAVIQSCLDGLLFWGGFAVIIGALGSAIGYHKAMAAVMARGVVNPRAVWIGSAEGMVTSIAGLLILAGAGACWYLLRWQYLRRQ
ncbi:MAG: hypothetical protein P8127_09335 [Acidobacteriota bacterium]